MKTDEVLDAVVIGAGVGGSCAAIALARRGARVALLEAGQLPHHKVCGEFLSPESRAVFQRLGVEDAILAARPVPVSSARIVSSTRKHTRERCLEIPLPAGAIALSRFRLDKVLWDAAGTTGVLCLDKTRVRRIENAGFGRFTIHAINGEVQARSIIAAVGRGTAWLERGTQRQEQPTSRV
ncbi:MAG TPA: FAD-dependent oxidoreductase, partial [Abditibacteriaceae bacterium]|nr:FAD-dependent oxidoreductase [Abditibacteriaceae bacterium]